MRQQVPPRLKTKSRHRTLAFNKPYGVLPCFTDAKGRPTLAEYVKAPGVYAAGRLDFDSEGLMVLTSDGGLAHHITDPQHKLPKIYLAQDDLSYNMTGALALGNGEILTFNNNRFTQNGSDGTALTPLLQSVMRDLAETSSKPWPVLCSNIEQPKRAIDAGRQARLSSWIARSPPPC